MNRKGQSSAAAVIVGFLLLAVGFIGGILFYEQLLASEVVAPRDHESIVEQIEITEDGVLLVCHFIDSYGSQYVARHSEWVYKAGQNSRAYMTILDGTVGTFNIEIWLLSEDTLDIECPDGTFTLDQENPKLEMEIEIPIVVG